MLAFKDPKKDNVDYNIEEVFILALKEEKTILTIKIKQAKNIENALKKLDRVISEEISKLKIAHIEFDCSELKLGKLLPSILQVLEIFSFKNLILKGNEITDDVLSKFFPHLKFLSDATLDLSNNKLTFRSIQGIYSCFTENQTFNVLNLTSNKFGGAACYFLIQNLANKKIKINELLLASLNFYSTAEDEPVVVINIKKKSKNDSFLYCNKLDFSKNFIKSGDAFFKILFKYIDGLKELNLSYNNLGNTDAIKSLMLALEKSELTAIKLILINNGIGPHDINVIKACRHNLINTLDLSDNKFTSGMASSLAEFINGNDHLESLALIKCQFNDIYLCETFSEGLEKNNGLVELNLDFNEITDKGVLGLRTGLLNHKKLSKLSLGNNKIGNRGAQYLANIFADAGLTHLGIESNSIENSGITPFANTLPKTQSLRELNLAGNPLRDEGIIRLAEGLEENKSVVKLNLAMTKMTDSSAEVLARKIKGKPIAIELETYTTGYSLLPFYTTVLVAATMTAAWSKATFFEPGISTKFIGIGGFLGSGFLYGSAGVIYGAAWMADKFNRNNISPVYKLEINSNNPEMEKNSFSQPKVAVDKFSKNEASQTSSQLHFDSSQKKAEPDEASETKTVENLNDQPELPLHFILKVRILPLHIKIIGLTTQIKNQNNHNEILRLQAQKNKLNEDILIRLCELDFYLDVKNQDYFKKNKLDENILHLLAAFNLSDAKVQKLLRHILEKVLIHYCRAVENITEKNNLGQTPLHIAAKENNTFFFAVLLKYDNFELLKENNGEETCIHIAAQWAETKLFKRLLEKLFQKKFKHLNIEDLLLAKRSSDKIPLLHYTVYRAYTLLPYNIEKPFQLLGNLQLLLEDYNKWFNINAINAKKQTVLHLAIMQKELDFDLINMLLHYEPPFDSNVDKIDKDKQTPFELAVHKKHAEKLYRTLLRKCICFETVQRAVKCILNSGATDVLNPMQFYCIYISSRLCVKLKYTTYASLSMEKIFCSKEISGVISLIIEKEEEQRRELLVKSIIETIAKKLTEKKLTTDEQVPDELYDIISNFSLTSFNLGPTLFKWDKRTLFYHIFDQKIQQYQQYAREQSIEAVPVNDQRSFMSTVQDTVTSSGKKILKYIYKGNNEIKLEVSIVKLKNVFKPLTKEIVAEAAIEIFKTFNITQISEDFIADLAEAFMQRIIHYINHTGLDSLNIQFTKICINGILEGSSVVDKLNLQIEDSGKYISISDFIKPPSTRGSYWSFSGWNSSQK